MPEEAVNVSTSNRANNRDPRASAQVSRNLLIAIAIFLLFGATTLLAIRPQEYTPIVSTLMSILLAGVMYLVGSGYEVQRATKQANDRWLPQAEAVILRLITLQRNVVTFEGRTRERCAETTCDLPDLVDNSMRAVRVKIKADCEAASDRLADIANQLEDAIADWHRFVEANCVGQECLRIFQAIEARKNRLCDHSTPSAVL